SFSFGRSAARFDRPPLFVIDLANRARGIDPQSSAPAWVADRMDALPRPRRTRRQLEPLDALRQRFELNHGQVPLAVFSDDFALDAFFADVPNVEIALGDQLPFLVHGKENNGSFAVAHNVFVGEHELAADVDDGAGATGILRALRRLSS